MIATEQDITHEQTNALPSRPAFSIGNRTYNAGLHSLLSLRHTANRILGAYLTWFHGMAI